jgi:hypothetical protein
MNRIEELLRRNFAAWLPSESSQADEPLEAGVQLDL